MNNKSRRISAWLLFLFMPLLALMAQTGKQWNCSTGDYEYDMSTFLSLPVEVPEDFELAAFCDGECRGVCVAPTEVNGTYYFFLRIWSNSVSGETITFSVCNSSTHEVTELLTTLTFDSKNFVGYPSRPLELVFPLTFEYEGLCYSLKADNTVEVVPVSDESGSGGDIAAKRRTALLRTATTDGRRYSGDIIVPEVAEYEGKSYTVSGIGVGAFRDCTDLQSVVLPSTVTAIEAYAFYGTGISQLVLPASVKTIGAYAFSEGNLTEIQCLGEIPPVCEGDKVFDEGVRIYVPESSCDTYLSSGVWTEHNVMADTAYKLTFVLDGVVIYEAEFKTGEPIVAPEVLEREGYTFSGWGDVPDAMPAGDSAFVGSFVPNRYTVSFVVDGEVVQSSVLDYGTSIVVPEAPEKEGHTFSGWGDVPSTVPASDLTVEGAYVVNQYTVSFIVDGEVVQSSVLDYGTSIVVPEAPEKEGHTFSGWGDVPSTVPASDLTVEGAYVVNQYTVSFVVDGEVVQSSVLDYGTSIVVPEAPEKEGHTFSGWGDVPSTVPASDLTVEGAYVVNQYTVSFVVDGEVVQSSVLDYGTSIVVPEAPEKEGHTFSGWGDVPSTVPASDLTVEGAYVVNQYTVSFIVDGEVVQSSVLDYGTSIVVPEVPEKEGHTFSGWGDVPSTVPASDLTVEGAYVVNQYTVSFIVDGEVVQSSVLDYGTSIVVPEAPEKEGHTFSGWGDVPSTVPASDLTVEGAYAVNQYTVSFVVDGEVVQSSVLDYGTSIVVPEVPEKEGHTFSGWGDVPSTVPASDLTVEGAYVVNQYTVSFIVDGEVVQSSVLDYGTSIVVPEAPEKEGHTFSGWGDVPSTVPASDLTVEGTYVVNQYTVSFIVDGEVVQSSVLDYGTSIVVPEAPEKEGHTFSGWGDVPSTVPASDLTVEGAYVVNQYTVSFIVDGEVVQSSVLDYGTSIVVPEVPEKEGHTFSGWGDVPSTVPASDVTVVGSFEINEYAVIYYVGDAEYARDYVVYNEKVVLRDYETGEERYSFGGWDGDVYETMPAHDIEYHAIIIDGVNKVETDDVVDVYSLGGVKIKTAVRVDRLQTELPRGIYIIRGKKIAIR